MSATPAPTRRTPSAFELLITCNPPILESLLSQVPTQTIFRLYQTSSLLRDFFQKSPTSWRYISWRLYQPVVTAIPGHAAAGGAAAPRQQSSNYALDQILLNIINPFSTRLTSLELDNTAVSGATLTSTVLILRRDSLTHVSVRGCKNVSLKYHINPWLQMHALARQCPSAAGPPGFETLALKSLYTYRCRHHRRRPYLPSSLMRKESDSEPTHELVLTCHKLGIWTDTAWCTTPGARCYRRRGYVKMRMPQDPREVWVVYDRLWRSRNWLGPVEPPATSSDTVARERKHDCRSWEFDEEALNGEPIGTGAEGKATPTHLRESHRKFVENIICQNCSDPILERCEQCSVMMHCSGCRKTLCASCAFDRPYLRNKNAPEEERNKFWWAPGCAVSPCSMQDQDLPPNGAANGQQNTVTNTLPNTKFRWCCTEPVFSGGGGITFGPNSGRDTDRIRAAPLPQGQGWEDPEFDPSSPQFETLRTGQSRSLSQSTTLDGPAGRWSSIDSFFQSVATLSPSAHPAVSVPRVLCDECYNMNQWKVKCKACSTALCLKHDIGDRMRARICGYKDLAVEKQEYRSRQKAINLLTTLMRQRKEMLPRNQASTESEISKSAAVHNTATAQPMSSASSASRPSRDLPSGLGEGAAGDPTSLDAEVGQFLRELQSPLAEMDLPHRPLSPASNSTGVLSRSTSPTPSVNSVTVAETSGAPQGQVFAEVSTVPRWQGCQAFFCPTMRTPGDHRRRCTAVMKQCAECKVHVCGDCANALDPPCPCRGCRPAQGENAATTVTVTITSNPTTLSTETNAPFFCPNCRWHRMLTGKCKRKSEAFLRAQSASQKLKTRRRRKEKIRKPLEDRRTDSTTNDSVSATEEAIDGLVEFFTSLNAQSTGMGQHDHTILVGELEPLPQTGAGPNHDIQELEDMGALARDLIRRIQRLREQFRPGSLAALALPDIRVEDEEEVSELIAAVGQAQGTAYVQEAPAVAPDGLNIAGPVLEVADDEEQLDGEESNTD
ncbi:uncharacterized protein HMPREF1120_00380 [Exophiala dermatitidis NIH/UT8656]|uniref:Uncharacterized protein n=1 Tax=Exophiala dermatitidis (strain ATCC 34100 / CBS 525.76 / NIH/UT8656) TaxID=858893 RepID=H6BN40_EXODN|nr:uncharacterized protein HMPREF1120_00380 [Exophiala dermatitidis NIH/UT8656]EHY52164.1 hypothetical protein HMPREF1120_00380 [Exophiala dermatitidis NIH/UT8656]